MALELIVIHVSLNDIRRRGKSSHIAVILINFQRIFDIMDHETLLGKISCIEFSEPVMELIKSCLHLIKLYLLRVL